MSDEHTNLEIVRQISRCWNSCDDEALLAFYDDEVDMIADPGFPDPTVAGKPAVAHWIEGWRGSWEELEMVVHELDASGNRVVAIGGWQTRGVASGIGGFMPWGILYTLREGLVVRHEWFLEPEHARTAMES